MIAINDRLDQSSGGGWRATRRPVLAPLAAAAVSLGFGAAGFAATQHVSFGRAVYWAVTTASTVGYGDLVPHNTSGRFVAAGVMLVAIPALAAAVAALAATRVTRHLHRRMDVIEDTVSASNRIAADTHKAVTGQDHPDAPAQP